MGEADSSIFQRAGCYHWSNGSRKLACEVHLIFFHPLRCTSLALSFYPEHSEDSEMDFKGANDVITKTHKRHLSVSR